MKSTPLDSFLFILFILASSVSAKSPDSLKENGQPFPTHAAVRLGGNFEMMLTDKPTWFSSGTGFEIEFIQPISRRFALTATYFRSGLHADPNFVWGDTAYTTTGSTLRYSSSMYLLGLEERGDEFLGVSFLHHRLFLKAGDLTQDVGGELDVRENATGHGHFTYPYGRESDFAFVLGLGFNWRLTQGVGVDIGFQRIFKIDRSSKASDDAKLGLWQSAAIRAGLTFEIFPDSR